MYIYIYIYIHIYTYIYIYIERERERDIQYMVDGLRPPKHLLRLMSQPALVCK